MVVERPCRDTGARRNLFDSRAREAALREELPPGGEQDTSGRAGILLTPGRLLLPHGPKLASIDSLCYIDNLRQTISTGEAAVTAMDWAAALVLLAVGSTTLWAFRRSPGAGFVRASHSWKTSADFVVST